jgi:hypothetical protein
VRFNAVVGGLALATLIGSSAGASTILIGPTSAMATNQSFSVSFNSASASEALSFIIDGYNSLDGKNAYEDDFSLKLNNQQIFLGTFNLGGGSNSGSQANVYFNPLGGSFSNLTNNGTGIGWNGGKELMSFTGVPLNIGMNTLTFAYSSIIGAGYAGFQGLGDEGWGIEKVEVGATPLPAALPLFASGLAAAGLFGWRRKRKAEALAA